MSVSGAVDSKTLSVEPPQDFSLWWKKRQRRQWIIFSLLFIGLIGITLLSISVGAFTIGFPQVIAILFAKIGITLPIEYTSAEESVLISIRIPRVILGLLVGGTLAISGAAIQGLFRNPLAEPGLIGTSGGAGMAAVMSIILIGWLTDSVSDFWVLWGMPLSAFLGSLAATFFVYKIACVNGRIQVATMLLAGVAINALAFSVMGLAQFLADDAQLRTITFWMLGSLANASWSGLMVAGPLMLLACVGIPFLGRSMDAMALGEAEAHHLGISVERVRMLTLVAVSLAVGAAVSLTGLISFVGLIVPHLLRYLIGPANRLLLPASLMLGAILTVAADLLARSFLDISINAPAELPLGVVTALIGAPYFLWLLIRSSRKGGFG